MLIVHTHLGIIHFWLSLTSKKEKRREGNFSNVSQNLRLTESTTARYSKFSGERNVLLIPQLDYVSTHDLKTTHNKNKSSMTAHQIDLSTLKESQDTKALPLRQSKHSSCDMTQNVTRTAADNSSSFVKASEKLHADLVAVVYFTF